VVGAMRHRKRTPSLWRRRSLDVCPKLGTVERVEDRKVAKGLGHDVFFSPSYLKYSSSKTDFKAITKKEKPRFCRAFAKLKAGSSREIK